MKWADYQKQITALNSEELEHIEIVAHLVSRRIKLGLTQRDVAELSGL